MKIEIPQMKVRVARLLSNNPRLRDNDSALIANIWNEDMKAHNLDVEDIYANVLLIYLASGKLSRSGSITRARRKVQEEHPHLRGDNYNERQDNQVEIINQIRS